nr:reverse transcriptase domain-containing protein [Tanacetum cinerariifolium]
MEHDIARFIKKRRICEMAKTQRTNSSLYHPLPVPVAPWIDECFPVGRFGKLQPRADRPFQVLKRINDNAYKIDLLGTYNVSTTFNVANLSLYVTDSEDDEDEKIHNVKHDSRVNLFQAGEYGAQ